MEEELFSRKIIPILIYSLLCFLSDIATSDLSSSTKYVVKGGEFTLLCPVPQPQTELQLWHKDFKSIKVDARNNYVLKEIQQRRSNGTDTRLFTIMSLTVNEADEIHTGVYQCRNLSQKVIVVTENMIVPNEDFPGMGKVLVPGEQLVLYCNTTECPSCTVLWSKDGEELNEVDGHIEIYDNNSVVINEASYNDTGVYVCTIDKETFDFTLSASIVVQSKIKMEKFESSSLVVVEGNPLELHCIAKGAPIPYIRWFKGDEEITSSSHPRFKLYEHNGLSNARFLIEEAEFEDRDYYTCEAYNQISSANTTVFIRIKDKLAALWPFLGICAEVAILCSIIFVYERRKNKAQFNEPDTDHPAENKHPKDQKAKGQDMRQRK